MTAPEAPTHATTDGLWRWLVGGLIGGGILLGLLVAAYAIGYDRGRHHAPTTPANAATSARPATAVPTSSATAQATLGAVPVTAALVARGQQLYTSDGCSGCHSLTGAPGAGPSLEGLATSTVKLVDGQTVTADDAYIERAITDPDAQIVDGYRAGIMPAAIASLALAGKPDDVRALVAFIKSRK
jgi:mono/diheme cytochrome c family protein